MWFFKGKFQQKLILEADSKNNNPCPDIFSGLHEENVKLF